MRINLSVALALVFIVGSSAFAASSASIPNSPAGRVFTLWLSAFNSGSRSRYAEFKTSYGTGHDKQAVEAYAQIYAATGGFDVRSVRATSPTSITVLMQPRASDLFASTTFKVRSAPPHRMLPGFIRVVDRPAAFAIRRMAQPQLLAQLSSRLEWETPKGLFAGAVLVANDGTPVFERAYGLADRSRRIPNSPDTKFRIGSMNKMFTATSIMQLVQAGKIGLDKPFGTYLSDYPNKSVSSAVTIRELLTHTGGTGDIFTPEYDRNRLKIRTLRDYVNLFGKRSLRFKPGSKWEYSNYGFILLGAIIERVSGQNYYDYVREHVYEPAGMTSTASEPENVAVANRSTGYTITPAGDLMPNTDTLPYRGTSAGGGYSTVGDLLRFANALLAHKLLNAKYTQMMVSAHVKTPGGGTYGFGFGQDKFNGVRCFGHNGGAPGMNGVLEICPVNGYVVTALSNLDPPAAENVAQIILDRLPQK